MTMNQHTTIRTPITASRPQCPVGETQCPIVEEVVQLRQQVITDPLTGLFNVRYFRTALAQELERTERTLLPTALIMLDLDHFKQVNDTWGHEVGNLVLQQTARLIRDSTRKLDIHCRYGGEEFAIILPSTERPLAIQVARRLCENIASTPLQCDGQPLNITASLGLALCDASHPWPADRLLNEADKLLYQAKHNGRNQVCYPPLAENLSAVTSAEKDLLHDLFGGADHADDDSEDFAGEEFFSEEE